MQARRAGDAAGSHQGEAQQVLAAPAQGILCIGVLAMLANAPDTVGGTGLDEDLSPVACR